MIWPCLLFAVLGFGLFEAKMAEQIHVGWTYVALPFAVATYFGVRSWRNI